MSLGSVLSVARQALAVQQNIIQTAGHNISNAETPGFSRQRVEVSAMHPQVLPFGTIGTGVQVDDIRRSRDALLDVTWRREAGGSAGAGLRRDLLSNVEGVLGEPSETGLAAAMDAMWSAWSDLAAAPTSAAARAVVVQRAGTVATTLNGFDQRLGDFRQQTQLRLTDTITQLNGLATQIAQVNGQIVSAEVSGNQAPDLRDRRDLLIDQMAQLGDVRVFEGPNGSAQVLVGNNLVVDGVTAKQFRIAAPLDASDVSVNIATVGDPARPLLPFGGRIGEMVSVLNGSLRDTQDRLDALATALARSVNAIHGAGVDASGAPAGPLFVDRSSRPTDPPLEQFDPGGDPFRLPTATKGTITARTIGVHLDLQTNPQRLATTSSAARPADNDVALAMAALRTHSVVTLPNATPPRTVRTDHQLRGQPAPDPTRPPAATLGEHYRAAASSLGTQVRDATSEAAVRQTLADQADQRRAALSGVNIDEELTTLMRAQQAYAAAAKVVSMADEMMQTLVAMI